MGPVEDFDHPCGIQIQGVSEGGDVGSVFGCAIGDEDHLLCVGHVQRLQIGG